MSFTEGGAPISCERITDGHANSRGLPGHVPPGRVPDERGSGLVPTVVVELRGEALRASACGQWVARSRVRQRLDPLDGGRADAEEPRDRVACAR